MTAETCLVSVCPRAAGARLVVGQIRLPVCVPHALACLNMELGVGITSMRGAP